MSQLHPNVVVAAATGLSITVRCDLAVPTSKFLLRMDLFFGGRSRRTGHRVQSFWLIDSFGRPGCDERPHLAAVLGRGECGMSTDLNSSLVLRSDDSAIVAENADISAVLLMAIGADRSYVYGRSIRLRRTGSTRLRCGRFPSRT